MAPLEKGRVGQQPEVERLIGGHTDDDQFAERPPHPGDGIGPVPPPGDDLAEQRVVVEGDLVAGLDAAIPADTGPRGSPQVLEATGGGRNPLAASSLVIRHSMAQPRGTSGPAGSRIGRPAAIRSCSRTRSRPYTISVTGCSTWIRVFISRK